MKTTSLSHTPTPWFVAYLEDGTPIIDAEYQPHGMVATLQKQYPQDDGHRSLDAEQQNAQFIVRACNNHAALVDVLKTAHAAIFEFTRSSLIDAGHSRTHDTGKLARENPVLVEIREALAAVGETA